jgi:L-fucose mutarotase
VWASYRKTIQEAGLSLDLEPIQKWEFYDAVNSPDHVLTVQTADQSLWANILIVMGCRTT